MATLHLVCPLSGLHYTLRDDYTVSDFQSHPHPSWNRLPTIIKKDKWRTPQSYIVAGMFHYLHTNELIAFPHQEPSTARATINATLARTFSSPLLYAVYLRLINSKAPLSLSPITVNLAALALLHPRGMLDQIELVALQSLKEQDRSALWSLSTTKHDRKKILSLNKQKRTHMAPKTVFSRLEREIPKLFRLLDDNRESLDTRGKVIPDYMNQALITRVAKAIPLYSQLTQRKQQDIQTILTDLFSVAIQNSYVSKDDILGYSYFWFIDKARKNLISTKSDFFTALGN